jgi:hypothetical protein
VRTTADANVGGVDAGCPQPSVSLGDVGHAPGQAPQPIGPVADLAPKVMRQLDDEITAAKEEEAHAPCRLGAVQAQAEPQASRIESDGALRVWRADHDMVEARDRAGLLGPGPQWRTCHRFMAAREHGYRDPMRRRRADLQRRRFVVRLGLRDGEGAPLEQPLGLVDIANGEGESRQSLACGTAWAAHGETHICKLN